jgi:hypothetical protein
MCRCALVLTFECIIWSAISGVTYVVKAMATLAAITEPSPALMASARAVVQSEAIAFAVESSSPKRWRRPNEAL